MASAAAAARAAASIGTLEKHYADDFKQGFHSSNNIATPDEDSPYCPLHLVRAAVELAGSYRCCTLPNLEIVVSWDPNDYILERDDGRKLQILERIVAAKDRERGLDKTRRPLFVHFP